MHKNLDQNCTTDIKKVCVYCKLCIAACFNEILVYTPRRATMPKQVGASKKKYIYKIVEL